MVLFEANILIKGIVTPMQCMAQNAVAARAIFEVYGKIISEVKPVQK